MLGDSGYLDAESAPVFWSAQQTAFSTLFYQHQLFCAFSFSLIVFFDFSILPSTATPRLDLGRFSSLTFKRRSFPTRKWVFSSQNTHIMIQFKKCTLYWIRICLLLLLFRVTTVRTVSGTVMKTVPGWRLLNRLALGMLAWLDASVGNFHVNKTK